MAFAWTYGLITALAALALRWYGKLACVFGRLVPVAPTQPPASTSAPARTAAASVLPRPPVQPQIDTGDETLRETKVPSANPVAGFVQSTLIPLFFRQRDKGHSEFAVVVLADAPSPADIGEVQFLPPRKPLVNRKQPFYPTINQGHVNYMVSRPNDANHCEATLLRHLPALWASCRRKAQYTPTLVLFYTWIQPCSACTDAIIAALNRHPVARLRRADFVLVYTVRWKRLSAEENEANLKRLVDSGITVLKVKYSLDL